MSSRFARIVSRLSIVSVVAVSALGAAACSQAKTSGTEAAAAPAKAAPAQHGPGYQVFREIEGLDLRASQRDAIAEVEQNLAADFAPHRETMRQVAETLARGVESGKLEPAEVDASKAALTAAVADVHDSIANALNEVHDVLDQGQRAELVARLRARQEHKGEPQDEAHRQQAMARFATELGLTDEQKNAIHEAVRDASEKVFPDRKERREAWEAKMKALGDAFIRDDFSAEDFELGSGAEEAIANFTQVAERAVDASGRILGPSQRLALAALIRERANAPHRQ